MRQLLLEASVKHAHRLLDLLVRKSQEQMEKIHSYLVFIALCFDDISEQNSKYLSLTRLLSMQSFPITAGTKSGY